MDSHQRRPKLSVVGKRMHMTEALSDRLQAIKWTATTIWP
jgi:hypothetical protein